MKTRSVLESVSPYNPPRLREEISVDHGSERYVKLTMNELSFGPLPEARAAIVETLSRAGRYPDRDATPLREAIARANPGLSPDNVVVGNGSSETLVDLMQILERPGEVVIPWPSFPFYVSAARVVGLNARKVTLDGHHRVDLDAMLAAVTDETRAIIVCNPNNPSGTYLPLAEVRRFAEALPEGVLVILDEAYYDFVDDPAYAGSHGLVLQSENVVSTRTFSKVHGLAGFRVGYGLAPRRLADLVWSTHVPFSVNQAGQAAAAASMGQPEAIAGRSRLMKRERERVQDAFGAAGLEYVPSHTNFVMVGAKPRLFEKTGVLVREGEALGYPVGWSRVTIGGPEENDRLLAALG
ncbi:MAG: aminotransferase class I/II-fold pyridoxal phosphate-dependent enzyme [Rubrobacter sp.]|nr:aminotransferase class I/II-fold pyridoxal phosphate-dependent enzyme [Rubrobacter sp.]MBA3951251.1 aminotransferase class I/II-fold pyridoxal phosphate-dependent enzyme [Rubrobacter sp.]MDQ3377506.1 aminotransferase class I/II-fold pyridoxal phosphate-dependent enzyme [Actinomycetota bacterium]